VLSCFSNICLPRQLVIGERQRVLQARVRRDKAKVVLPQPPCLPLLVLQKVSGKLQLLEMRSEITDPQKKAKERAERRVRKAVKKLTDFIA